MTRKHFIQLADVIINNPRIYYDEEFFISDLMDMCEEANNNFDKKKFTQYIEKNIDQAEEL